MALRGLVLWSGTAVPRQLDTGESAVSVIGGLVLMRVVPETFVKSSMVPQTFDQSKLALRGLVLWSVTAVPRQLDTGESAVSVIWGLALMRVVPETFVQSGLVP